MDLGSRCEEYVLAMRFERKLVWSLCFLMLSSCGSIPLREARWSLCISDGDGVLWLVRTSPARVLRNPNDLSISRINTIGRCLGGSIDEESGWYATLEEDPAGSVIRLYSGSGAVAGEAWSDANGSERGEMSSYPVMLKGSKRVAFVRADGMLVVGSGDGSAVTFRSICKLAEAEVAIPEIMSLWVDGDGLVIGYYDEVYYVDIESASARKICDGTLLGMHDGNVVLSDRSAGIVGVALDGQIKRVFGRVRSGIPYSGHIVHRISPDGEYVAYDAARRGQRALVIHHLDSGRKAYVGQIKMRWLGSWTEMSGSGVVCE